MSLEALDGMTADEVRAVDLRVLLYEEREWLARCAVATLGNSAYAATVQAEDVASEIILCIAQPQVIMDRQADMAPDSRARSLRAYCMQIIRTQWRRKFHSQYASVGNADIDEVESVITHDAPERLRTCGISIEQEALLKWEELEDDRRSTMQLETLRDAFPAQQFKVLELSIVGGLGPADSARMLNCSTNNVHGLLRKARRRLQEIYESQGGTLPDSPPA